MAEECCTSCAGAGQQGFASGSGPTPALVEETPASSTVVTSIPAAIVATGLAAANAARLGLSIFNDSQKPLTLLLGVGVTLVNRTTILPPKSEYSPPYRYTGPVEGIWAAGATGSAAITELVP